MGVTGGRGAQGGQHSDRGRHVKMNGGPCVYKDFVSVVLEVKPI